MAITHTDHKAAKAGPADRLLTVPNALCLVRLLGAFVLPFLAMGERPVAFIVTYFALTSTDWIDGKLARWLNQESRIGPKLDTVADITMYAGLLFGVFWLFSGTLVDELAWLVVAVGLYAGSCLTSLFKFRRLPSYHTRAAKISWFIVLVAVIALFLDWSLWPLRVSAVAVALTNLEAILITVVLAKPKNDIASLWHAVRSD